MNRLKNLSIILLHGVFLLLIVMAILLYKQRFFADSSYFFFHAVNSGWFHIEHGRILLGFSQLIPIVASYLGFSLKYLMLGYSAGVELIYYFLFLFLVYKLKDLSSGIALLLIHLIGQLWLFHVPSLEICHGAALAVVFYAILRSNKWSDDKWLILMILTQWLVLFSHPANMFLIAFLIGWDIIGRAWKKGVHLPLLSLFGIGLLIKILTLSSYDQTKLKNSNALQVDQAYGLDYWKEVFGVIWDYYPDLVVLLFVGIGFLLIKGKVLKFVYVVGSIIGFLVLASAIEGINQFGYYIEALLTPLVFIVVFTFCLGCWGQLAKNSQAIVLTLVVVLCFIRVFWILDFSKSFAKRTESIDQIVGYTQTLANTKYIISEENINNQDNLWNWATPIEVLLFSAMDGAESTVSVISDYDLAFQQNKRELIASKFLFRRFDVEEISSLNHRFFQLKEVNYLELNTTNMQFDYKSIADKVSIALVLPNEKLSFSKSDTVFQRIMLSNQSELAIPSNKKSQVFISYHWYKNGEIYEWDGIRNVLEVDLIGNYTQYIQIIAPEDVGTYYLKPDIVIEGVAWFNLENSYRVEVVER